MSRPANCNAVYGCKPVIGSVVDFWKNSGTISAKPPNATVSKISTIIRKLLVSIFSWLKKLLQRLGSAVVRIASGTNVADAPSGFRAMTCDVALRLNVFNSYTYTLETLIQAGRSNIRVISVPVRTNPDMRPSRLVRSMSGYVFRSLWTIVRIFATYRPMVFFWILSAFFGVIGVGAGTRYLILRALGQGSGHVQSVILAAVCITACLLLFVLGFLADLMSTNRRLLEKIDWRLRRLEMTASARSSQRESSRGVRRGEP